MKNVAKVTVLVEVPDGEEPSSTPPTVQVSAAPPEGAFMEREDKPTAGRRSLSERLKSATLTFEEEPDGDTTDRATWGAAHLSAALERRKKGLTPTLTWDEARKIAADLGVEWNSKEQSVRPSVRPPPKAPPPSESPASVRPPKPRPKLRNLFNREGAPDSHDLAAQFDIEWTAHGGPRVPLLQEMWLDFKRLFTLRGRHLLTLKKRLKEQILEARLDLDRLVTYIDERSQGIRLRRFLAEEHDMIDTEMMEELKSAYPNKTVEERRSHLDRMRRGWRRRFLYRALTDPSTKARIAMSG